MKLRPPINRLLDRARRKRSTMKIAVEGCCHGELDQIYKTLEKVQEREGVKVELLICCGDFQAARNDGDLASMAVPPKYRKMNTFYKYYSGEKTAPVLTLFIGGNHEASNHLWELSYGGWVAPKIYYLGNAGVLRYGGLRIAGLSGIYKQHDYGKGHFERPPYNEGTKRSAYHVRSCDVFRLKQLSGHVDIMLSHDWPLGIYHHGNTDKLVKIKPYFADEISRNDLGSPPAMELLQCLRPDYWFSAHLHVKFAAVYPHKGGGVTKFLALDKCLPRRKFLQILDVPTPTGTIPPQLEWDPEWLAILRATQPLMRYTPALWLPPHPLTDERHTFTPTKEELKEVDQLLGSNFAIPNNFTKTVPPYDPSRRISQHAVPVAQENPQTADFCHKLRINNPFSPDAGDQKPLGQRTHYPWIQDSDSSGNEESLPQSSLVSFPGGLKSGDQAKLNPGVTAINPDEIVLSDSSDGSDHGTAGGLEVGAGTQSHTTVCQLNPDEIALSDSEGDSVDQAGERQTSSGSHAPISEGGEPSERSMEEQGPESVLSRVTTTGSSAEKEDLSVMFHKQNLSPSEGTGDSGVSSAQGRKPLLLPCPTHPTTSSPATELGGTRTEPSKDTASLEEQTTLSCASTEKEMAPPPEWTADGVPAEVGCPSEVSAGSSSSKRPCHGSPDQRPKIKRRNVALYASRDEDSDSN